jgi:uncharacterized ion transporter superfamily protein YfcC
MRLGPLEIIVIIVIIIAAVIIARIARSGRGTSVEKEETTDIMKRPAQQKTNRFQGLFRRTGIALVLAGIILLIAGISLFQWALQNYAWAFVIMVIGFIMVLLTRNKR